MLLPRIIRMIDSAQPEGQKLGSQYVSIVEVGGAYAHLFFDLLGFLELKTLVITDIDTVARDPDKKRDVACPVHLGSRSSNACINAWFTDPKDAKAKLSPTELLAATEQQKIDGKLRLAYQLPETDGGPCGRSFEDAFILANDKLFSLTATTNDERATEAYDEAKEVKKADFALNQALAEADWTIPRYIREGLLWLAADGSPGPPAATPVAEVPNA